MATITCVNTVVASNVRQSFWETITATNSTGELAEFPDFPEKTVQVTGTFGGTLTMQGSNDGTNFFTLTDVLGNNVAFTAAGAKKIHETPRYVRPSAGVGVTDVDVTLISARN